MPGTCEVCVSEPSKYRCPTCGLMSCSLACTQSHKIYCAPKALPPNPSEAQEPSAAANGDRPEAEMPQTETGLDIKSLGTSSQLKELLDRFPSLRDQLQDIYQATLEEEWQENQPYVGRHRGFGRGRATHRHRGPWTREKGFNRGVGKVRKLRERCEEGDEVGQKAEGYMRFMALITGNQLPGAA